MEERKKYSFSNGKITIEIAKIGAELKSLKTIEGIEYIWCGNPEYWNFSAPFLFPIVGTLKDKKTTINGKTYNIMQHGLLRHQEFEIIEKTATSISLENTFNEETLKIYPFKYKVIVTYILNDYSVDTKIKVINLDNVLMPFNLGGHPGFNCPLYPQESFDDYTIHFEKAETFLSPKVTKEATLNFLVAAREYRDLTNLPLRKEDFNLDTIIIQRVKSKKVFLVNKNNKGICFEFPKFKTLAIWTPHNDAPFICLEPWIGYNDHYDTDGDFFKKDDLVLLAPEKDFEANYKITILN